MRRLLKFYDDHGRATDPKVQLIVVPRSLAPAEEAYIRMVLATPDEAFDSWGLVPMAARGEPQAQEVVTPAVLQARGLSNPQSLPQAAPIHQQAQLLWPQQAPQPWPQQAQQPVRQQVQQPWPQAQQSWPRQAQQPWPRRAQQSWPQQAHQQWPQQALGSGGNPFAFGHVVSPSPWQQHPAAPHPAGHPNPPLKP